MAQSDNERGNRPAQQNLQWRLRSGKHKRVEVVIVTQAFECLADGAKVEVEPKDVDCSEEPEAVIVALAQDLTQAQAPAWIHAGSEQRRIWTTLRIWTSLSTCIAAFDVAFGSAGIGNVGATASKKSHPAHRQQREDHRDEHAVRGKQASCCRQADPLEDVQEQGDECRAVQLK